MNDVVRARGPFLVLLSLKDGPKHGYEIASHIKDKGEGFFSISFGSLYPVLHKLEKDSLIKGAWEEIGDAKNKKVYALTSKGRKTLENEVTQYQGLIRVLGNLMEIKI